jgi:hypothetical protein
MIPDVVVGSSLPSCLQQQHPDVAYTYARISNGNGESRTASIVYQFDEGMIDRGASVQWLSQFPAEAEEVFPPLTFLQVIEQPQKTNDDILLVKLRVNLNLKTNTVDDVVHKAKKMFIETLEWYIEEVRACKFVFGSAVRRNYVQKVKPQHIFIPCGYMTLKMLSRKLKTHHHQSSTRKSFIAKPLMMLLISNLDRLTKSWCCTHFSVLTLVNCIKNKIEYVKELRIADFANSRFVKKYARISQSLQSSDGNLLLTNYPLVWEKKICKGSWASLARLCASL